MGAWAASSRAALLVLGLAAVVAARAELPVVAGRLSWLAGSATLSHGLDGIECAARINWPLTSGDVLATGSNGRAEVWVGSTALRLDLDSRIVFERLDDERLVLRLERGTLALRLATPEAARIAEVSTPSGSFKPRRPGEYRIDRHGLNATTDDDFARFVQGRDAAYGGRVATRYVSPEMTGIESLDGHGHWSQRAEHGAVWWPEVGPGWVPYREGRWAKVSPWGWTWIDDEPWGFAPFHYGRWIFSGGRWGWVPGRYAVRPAYAPALVGWVGEPGWEALANAAFGASVGWFPLGPREPASGRALQGHEPLAGRAPQGRESGGRP